MSLRGTKQSRAMQKCLERSNDCFFFHQHKKGVTLSLSKCGAQRPRPHILRQAQDDSAPFRQWKAIHILVFLFIFHSSSFAQSPYTNQVLKPEIKTVEFFNTKKNPSFPVIRFNSEEQLQLD